MSLFIDTLVDSSNLVRPPSEMLNSKNNRNGVLESAGNQSGRYLNDTFSFTR